MFSLAQGHFSLLLEGKVLHLQLVLRHSFWIPFLNTGVKDKILMVSLKCTWYKMKVIGSTISCSTTNQCCGAGTGSGWIRIFFPHPDPEKK